MSLLELKQSRFELRLTTEERAFFERASKISGYKTFASFVTSVLREESKKIISKNDLILASQKDKELFFDSIFSDKEPNENLKAAAKEFKKFQQKNES